MVPQARILITPDFLRELLHLPIGTELRGSGAYHYDQIELFLSHPDLPDVPLGDRPPLITPTFRRQEAVVFVDWGQ